MSIILLFLRWIRRWKRRWWSRRRCRISWRPNPSWLPNLPIPAIATPNQENPSEFPAWSNPMKVSNLKRNCPRLKNWGKRMNLDRPTIPVRSKSVISICRICRRFHRSSRVFRGRNNGQIWAVKMICIRILRWLETYLWAAILFNITKRQ